jgi:hypothetical protein
VLLGLGVEDLLSGGLKRFGVFGVEVLCEVVLNAELVVGPDFVDLVDAGLGYRQVDATAIFC